MLLAIFVFGVLLVWASADKNLRYEKEIQNYPGLFTINDHVYLSKEEFIMSGKRCGTKDLSEDRMFEIEQKLASTPEESDNEKRKKLNIITFFHVIKDSSGNGALTEAEIESQMDALNAGFKQTRTFFELQGTTETENDDWFAAEYGSAEESDMKSSLHVGDSRCLNIYSIQNSQGILGWATFPSEAEGDLDGDGVVIDYRTIPGGAAAPYNEGDTLTHEVGHWMGLYHTFQGGCKKNRNQGDGVKDTPAVASPNFGCPDESTNSCPGKKGQLKGKDLVHNFMDYVDDDCMWEFTKGQKDRMRKMWRTYRK